MTEAVDSRDTDRDRGILSHDDRRYIKLSPAERDESLSSSGQWRREKAIHERTRDAVLDGPLVNEFVDPETVVGDVPTATLRRALREHVAFIYRLAEAEGLNPEQVLDRGARAAHRVSAEQLAEQFREDPESLTISEVRELKKAGVMDNEEIADLLEQPAPPIGHVSEDERLPFLFPDESDAVKDSNQ